MKIELKREQLLHRGETVGHAEYLLEIGEQSHYQSYRLQIEDMKKLHAELQELLLRLGHAVRD